MREIRTYEIYSVAVECGNETISQTIECKQPSKLKSYKDLESEFDSGNLFSYGYRVKE